MNMKTRTLLLFVLLVSVGASQAQTFTMGKKCRAALAKLLLSKSDFLLLDEPTAGLDPVRRNAVYAMITDFQKKFGFTAVMISHEVPGIFFLSQRIAMLDEGKIRFEGTPEDLVARGKDRVFDPDRIKAVIDHVTPAKDSKTAAQGKILRDWARRQGIRDFFDIGRNGVCHAIFPEKGFVRPGYTIIMGDSHTCTHGAFGAFAAGVGTTDLEVGILKGVCAFRLPETLRIDISGTLADGVYAKDVILHIAGKLGTEYCTYKVIEFAGPVVENWSVPNRLTLTNMCAELGAKTAIVPSDERTREYLESQGRGGDWVANGPDPDANYGETLSIHVDELLHTSAPDVLAAGDCADAVHGLTGDSTWIPLALRANRAGWAVADNVCGMDRRLDGVAGSAVFKVFDLQVARTGLNMAEAQEAGFEAESVTIKSRSRAHAHPGSSTILVHMVGDRGSGRLLGMQMVGRDGAAHRLHAPAVALHAHMSVEQFSLTDLGYAPPFGPTWDPMLTAANQLLKKL